MMRRILLMLLGTAVLCSWSFAAEEAPVAKKEETMTAAHQHVPLNNVVKMDKEGKRTALCCCGYEFTVTPTAPTMDHEGTMFYMCGEGCKEMAVKATPEENAKTMKAWHEKYDKVVMADNTQMKDEVKKATCVCGAEFTVTETTPTITENGVTLYMCGSGCAEHFSKLTAEERMGAEKNFVAGM